MSEKSMSKEEKDVYRYKLVNKDKVVLLHGFTYDINRREREEKARRPEATFVRVGRKVELSVARKWVEKKTGAPLKLPPAEIASILTKNYAEIIEILVPTRFYWNSDDTFDGIEFGPFKTVLHPWQEDMMNRCLDAMIPAIGEKRPETE